MTIDATALSAGLGEHSYYRSLPREYYIDENIFAQEWDRVFTRQWLLAGHECQIPERGDYFTVEFAGESIIITRTDAGEVHAMYNVCRHRGSQICDDRQGRVKSFTCPYHAWSYAPDGTLESAPTIPSDGYVDFRKFGLKTVRSDTWRGYIFIYLGNDEPAPVTESIGKVEAELPDIDPRSLKVAHTADHTLHANWKLLAENNLECYHCDFCHDILIGAANLEGFKVQLGDAVRYAVQDRNLICGNGAGIELRTGAESMTVDGSFAVPTKLLNDGVGMGAGFSAGLHVAPVFGAILFYADHIVMQTNFPDTVGTVQQRVQWLVRADAVEGVDYEVEDVVTVFDVTVREDVEIIERNARGAASRVYEPGPLSKTDEPLNHVMLSMYLEWMSE